MHNFWNSNVLPNINQHFYHANSACSGIGRRYNVFVVVVCCPGTEQHDQGFSMNAIMYHVVGGDRICSNMSQRQKKSNTKTACSWFLCRCMSFIKVLARQILGMFGMLRWSCYRNNGIAHCSAVYWPSIPYQCKRHSRKPIVKFKYNNNKDKDESKTITTTTTASTKKEYNNSKIRIPSILIP